MKRYKIVNILINESINDSTNNMHGGANPNVVWNHYCDNTTLKTKIASDVLFLLNPDAIRTDHRIAVINGMVVGGIINYDAFKQLFIDNAITPSKHLEWIIKGYINGCIQLIDMVSIDDAMSKLHTVLNNFIINRRKKDFKSDPLLDNYCGLNNNTYTEKGKILPGLLTIAGLDDGVHISHNQKLIQERDIARQGSTIVYDDKIIKVIDLFTEEAAIYYGQNTKWCTAAIKSESFQNQFNYYKYYGHVYVVIPYVVEDSVKRPDEKYQIVFETSSFFNELNIPVNDRDDRDYRKYEKSLKAFTKKILDTVIPGDERLLKNIRLDNIRNNILFNMIAHAMNDVFYTQSERTGLFFCKFSDLELTKEYLKKYSPNLKDNLGETPLFHAIKTNIVEFLLKNGADPNISNNIGKTPLFYKMRDTDSDDVKLLLENGADPNIKDNLGKTPLFYTTCTKIIELLLKNGANPNIINKDGETYAHCIIHIYNIPVSEKINIINTLLVKQDSKLVIPFNPNICDISGNTLLHYIMSSDKMTLTWSQKNNIIKTLIEHGIDLNIKNNDERTPLYYACVDKPYNKISSFPIHKYDTDDTFYKNEDYSEILTERCQVVKTLLENGALPNSYDTSGNTVLHYIMDVEDSSTKWNEKNNIIKLLIDHNADLNIQNKSGLTPLHYICIVLDAYVYNPLIEIPLLNRTVNYDTEINIKIGGPIQSSLKYLRYIATPAYYNIIVTLLKNGANPNIQDNTGKTPLHYAKLFEIVKILLYNQFIKAQPNVRDNLGKKPIYYMNMLGSVYVLIKAGTILETDEEMYDVCTILLHIISKVMNGERNDVLKTLFDVIMRPFGKVFIKNEKHTELLKQIIKLLENSINDIPEIFNNPKYIEILKFLNSK